MDSRFSEKLAVKAATTPPLRRPLGANLSLILAFLACVGVFSSPAVSQVPASAEPGHLSGRFAQPLAPKAKPGGVISLPATVAPGNADSIKLTLKAVRIAGNSIYSKGELDALAAGLVGKRIALSDIYALAQTITARYGKDGYVLSRAIVPPQDIDPNNATVTIRVVEAYVDTVVWPTDFSKYRDFFSAYAKKITGERPSNIKTVMRYLLLAGDLPGIDVTSRFEASASNPNASTLVVEATEKPVEATAEIDNRGTDARGPWQFLVSGTFNNLLHQHEALTATFAGTSQLSELQYAALNYHQVLTGEGLTVFADASYDSGAPGTAPLLALTYNTRSLAADIGLSYPVIRSREENLTLSALAFLSNNEGDILGAPSSDDRLRGARIKADFDYADDKNGVTQVVATLSHGFEGLGSTQNGSLLASREKGRVDFTTLDAEISRTQQLGKGWSLFGAASAQYAFTPLLSPEECGYGGKDFGRAFDPSEITGDSCILTSAEIRFNPDIPNNALTQTQLYGFVDYGKVLRIAPSLGTATSDAGASAGAGIRLGNEHFSTDVSAAKPLMGRLDDGWRLFMTASAKY
jgi:hemolysin activation/secretion protein